MKINGTSGWWKAAVSTALLCSALAATGCQITVGGQTLPSPYYLEDDVQYFNPGTEAPLPRESAALKAYAADRALLDAGGGFGP